ncbi:MAG TPA: heme exporter protein CcmD [Gammaproteobacteria bacterium]|nr:heme exporter protein CcmD [Gammaproteobacteria bacterium]
MQEFFLMDGYAFYVWSAFGLTTLILIGNWWLAKRRYAQAAVLVRRRQLKANEVQS